MALTSASTVTSLASLAIPASYGWVLFTAVLICFHYSLHAIPVMNARQKYFTKEFFKENFPDVRAARNGYPDMGSGLYASKLHTENWISFNNAQRAHLNYLENLTPQLVFILISGLMYPRYTLIISWVLILARTMITFGYLRGGADKRGRINVMISAATGPLLAFGAFASACQIGGGINGLYATLKG